MATTKRRHPTGSLSWAEALSSVAHGVVDTVPEGWKTIVQIAEETKRSRPHTYRLLQGLLQSDRAEHKDFKIQTTTRVVPIPHYRLK